jgi:hypothetical protein
MVSPSCLGTSGSVRASRMAKADCCAPDVHTFWPLTIHTSPSLTALVRRPATSEPAPGSENIWHHTSSPRSSGGMWRFFCSSVPCVTIVGPAMPRPITPIRPIRPVMAAKPAAAASSLKISWYRPDSPWPPYSFGHVIPT